MTFESIERILNAQDFNKEVIRSAFREIKEAFQGLRRIGGLIFADGTSQTTASQTYTAHLTQNGTGAPGEDVFANSLGDIVWTREAEGVYYGTLANAFGGNVDIQVTNANLNPVGAAVLDADTIQLTTGGDSVLDCRITIALK